MVAKNKVLICLCFLNDLKPCYDSALKQKEEEREREIPTEIIVFVRLGFFSSLHMNSPCETKYFPCD